MYLWVSHRISVAKFCGGGWRKLAIGCDLFWLNLSHSHFSLFVLMDVIYVPV